MRSTQLTAISCAVLLLGSLCGGLVSGCGGASTASSQAATAPVTGRTMVSVRWPEGSRLIPFAANSIRVQVVKGNSLLGEALLVRPPNGGPVTMTIDRLPVGNAVMRASAHPDTNGGGVAQARAEVGLTITAGVITPVHLTLASTIDRIEITPALTEIDQGQTAQLIATARNADDEVVITHSATYEWSTNYPLVATIEPDGLLHALDTGSTTVTATERESGKVGTLFLLVIPPPPTPSGVKCDPASGHCYEIVAAGRRIPWDEAKTEAEARRFNNRPGHLVSVTTPAEMTFLTANFTRLEYLWMGGYQDTQAADYSEPGGGWRWITGEPWAYTNWEDNEPNELNPSENYLQFWKYVPGRWNDIPRDFRMFIPQGYVVEYEP